LLTAAAVRRNDPNLVPQPALKAFAKPIRVGAVRISEPAGNDLHFHDINFIAGGLSSRTLISECAVDKAALGAACHCCSSH